jgi:hypothetical protein
VACRHNVAVGVYIEPSAQPLAGLNEHECAPKAVVPVREVVGVAMSGEKVM